MRSGKGSGGAVFASVASRAAIGSTRLVCRIVSARLWRLVRGHGEGSTPQLEKIGLSWRPIQHLVTNTSQRLGRALSGADLDKGVPDITLTSGTPGFFPLSSFALTASLQIHRRFGLTRRISASNSTPSIRRFKQARVELCPSPRC